VHGYASNEMPVASLTIRRFPGAAGRAHRAVD